MKKQLIEISKGTGKGLIGTVCLATIMGLPAADGLYESIKTKEGKISYWVVNATLFTAAFAALYSIGN